MKRYPIRSLSDRRFSCIISGASGKKLDSLVTHDEIPDQRLHHPIKIVADVRRVGPIFTT